jgi:transcriptional regulator with XRE-family HTH domain
LATLYERLETLCKERGVKGSRLGLDIGYGKSLMTDLKSGRKKSINAETAQKIATYFGVTVGYLLGEDEQKEKPTAQGDGLSDEKRRLIERIKTLSEEQIEALLLIAESIQPSGR